MADRMSLAVHAWPAPAHVCGRSAFAMAEATGRSFADLYRANAKFVWRMLRRLGVPDADLDDAMHEVFLVAFRRRESLWGADFERSWLFGIARRVAQQTRRKVGRRPDALEDDAHMRAAGHGPEGELAQREQLALARAAIEGIDARRRIVFVMSELEQMSAPEIARALEIPVNTVYSRLRKARTEFEDAVARLRGRVEKGGARGRPQ
jgi:RNA polymerase sigma-70 factor (ECF subfamily)